MAGDWIKIHRKVLESRIFSDRDPFLVKLWVWCLSKANWKEAYWDGKAVPRGTFVTGRGKAAEQLGVSESKFRRGVEKLKEYGCIKVEATNRYTLIRVEKYDLYQSPDSVSRPSTDQPATINRPASDHQPTTIEEGKEGKQEIIERERVGVKIPRSLSSPEFAETWQDYERWWLSSLGTRLDPIKAKLQLEDLSRSGSAKAIEDLKLTMRVSTRPGRIYDSARETKDKNAFGGPAATNGTGQKERMKQIIKSGGRG